MKAGKDRGVLIWSSLEKRSLLVWHVMSPHPPSWCPASFLESRNEATWWHERSANMR